MGESIKAYIAALGKWGFVVAAIIIGDALGIVQSYSTDFIVPTWAWWILLVVILLITPFIAFYNMHKDKRELQRKIDGYESLAPQLTLGQGVLVKHNFDEQNSTMLIKLGLSFRNIGQKPAYQFRMRLGFAPDGAPERFQIFDERSCVNRLDPNSNNEFGQKYDLAIQYEKREDNKVIPVRGVMIHCTTSYSNSETGGKLYRDEWWLSYRTDSEELKNLSARRKEGLEPYVRSAYNKAEVS